MRYRFRTLAFGCAAAALGSALPVAAPHAEETVPGMLRCFEDGIETATIGPIFRVWSASEGEAAPSPDGCHWQPMTRIDMPGSAPPPQAIVSTEADETDTPDAVPTGGSAGNAHAALPSAEPAERPAGVGQGEVMPPFTERSLRMPVDLAVAAELTADAIAVETAALEPLPDPLDPTVMAGTGPAPTPETRREPIVVDLALSLAPVSQTDTAAAPHAEAATAAARAASAIPAAPRPNPHPPLARSIDRRVPADPFATAERPADAGAEPREAVPTQVLLLAGLVDGDVETAGSAALPALLAETMVPPASEAEAVGPRPALAQTREPTVRPNPHAGIPMPAPRREPVVLASLTPDGHRSNPHPDLPEGWSAASLADPAEIVVAAGDLPRRGDAELAGAPAEQGVSPVTLPGWRVPAPRVPVARSAAVRPEPPAATPETLVAEAEEGSAANKIQTANRPGAEDTDETAAAPERARIEVAQAEAVAAPPRPGASGIDTASADAIAAVASVRVPADRPAADPEDPVAAARGAAPASEAPSVEAAADPVTDGWWLQLASLDSPERALWEWNRRTDAAAGRLDGHAPTVVQAEIENRGTFYRLWVGPFESRADAGRLCARIEGPQEPCFVHRMDGQPVALDVAAR